MFARDLAIFYKGSCWSDDELKKDIDDAYDDSEYHAPNNNVRHSDTTNYASIRPSTRVA